MIRTVQKRTVLALLMDVNGLVRLELNRALDAEHFEVLWATTTREAVAAYSRRHIDLLLLDFNQPLMVSWGVFEPVGAFNPAIPIVMVTERMTELEQRVAERVSARLEKPFGLPALIQTIHLLLASQRKPICKRSVPDPSRTICARPKSLFALESQTRN